MKSRMKINIVIVMAIIFVIGIIFGMYETTNIETEKIASKSFWNLKNQENVEKENVIKDKNEIIENIINARKSMQRNSNVETFDLEVNDGENIEIPPIKPTTLKIVKKDEQEVVLLEGAKFTIKEIITKEDGTTEEIDVVDRDGNEVGTEEEINGERLRVITTNEKGEIKENLKAGKYRLTEVKAPEGFKLAEKAEDNIYDVEIVSTIVSRDIFEEEYTNYYQMREPVPAPRG